jgi:hypothetical protein
MYACMYGCMDVWKYANMLVERYICIDMYVCMHICMNKFVGMSMYVYTYKFVCAC